MPVCQVGNPQLIRTKSHIFASLSAYFSKFIKEIEVKILVRHSNLFSFLSRQEINAPSSQRTD